MTKETKACETTVKCIQKSSVLWSKSFREEACINIPLIGRRCVGVSASVAVVEENSNFYIEIEVLGYRQKFELGNACFPVNYGIGSIDVCVSNLDLSDNTLRSFDIVVKLCIGVRLLGQNLHQCWDVLRKRIVVSRASIKELMSSEVMLTPMDKDVEDKALIQINIPIEIDIF